MALHFGKRDPEPTKPLSTGLNTQRYGAAAGNPVAGSASFAGATPTTEGPTPVTDTTTSASATPEGGSKLTVGPNIKLKGVEITDCDTLVVEGTVEATMDSRVIHISENGAFKGSAEIDIAEIHGEFNGTLTVRHKLVIYSTGKVNGKIRYGKLVVEEGGQLAGEIEAGIGAGARASAAPAVVRAEPAAMAA